LTDQACNNISPATGGVPDDDAHRLRRIGLRPYDARGGQQRGSTRGQMQKLPSVGEFHGALLFSRRVSHAEYRVTRSCPGLFVNCSPAVGTNAAIGMKRASARSPGSSEMMKATAVPVWV
jgi:hypothetical protein